MTSKLTAKLALLYATVSCGVAAQIQGNIQKLEGFKSIGASLNIETAPQGGARAAALKANFKQVKLSPGFRIGLYAIVPDARHMTVDPNMGVAFVGTRRTRVWTVPDRTKGRVADEVKVFTPSTSFKIPNGLCFSPDGVLYVTKQNRVLAFPTADFFCENPGVATASAVPQGELIPVEEESFNHTARTCRVGPDDKLYITLGNPFNVPPREKVALHNKVGMMGIIRVDRNGKHREVFARSMRNLIGMDFSPKDKTLWFIDSRVDGMGDDTPPDELDRTTKTGRDFGFPWYGGGYIRAVEYKSETPPPDVVFPQVEMTAHATDLGMTFYKGRMFPARYQGGVFSAQHDSRNYTTPVGVRIMYTPVKTDGAAGKTEVFVEGWLTSNNEYLGRPADVATLSGGSLLISDDHAGATYRVSCATK